MLANIAYLSRPRNDFPVISQLLGPGIWFLTGVCAIVNLACRSAFETWGPPMSGGLPNRTPGLWSSGEWLRLFIVWEIGRA